MSRTYKLTAMQEAELVAWARGRQTVTAKAAELGISTQTLYAVLARHGLPFKPRNSKVRLIREYLAESRAGAP